MQEKHEKTQKTETNESQSPSTPAQGVEENLTSESFDRERKGQVVTMVKKTRGYLIYLLFVLIFCQILDSYTSDGIAQRVTAVVYDFFPDRPFEEGLGVYTRAAAIISMGTYFAIINQWLADRFGRKILLVITTLLMGLIPLIQIFIKEFAVYAVFAFFLAIVTQADIWMIYINEEAPVGKNAIWSYLVGFGGLVGAILIFVMRGMFITDDPATSNWRGMLYLSVILGIILTIVIITTLKETDAFLYRSAQRSAETDSIKMSFKEIFGTIFHSDRRRAYIAILAVSIFWAWGMMFLKYTEPFMMEYSLITSSEYNVVAIIGVLGLGIFTLITGFLADKIGRRFTFFLYSILYPAMTLLSILWASQIGVSTTRIVITGIFVAVTYGTGYGMWTLISITTIELMPTETRGMSLGVKTAIQALAATLMYFILGYLIPVFGLKAILIITTCIMLLVGPTVLLFIPETRGRNLKTIQ